jgi:CRP-like cAMP-binding protein
MSALLQLIDDPLGLLLPLAYGLAVFALLMLLYCWLRRFRALSWVGTPIGEMALLTGEPRRATVLAEEDTEALVVDRADLAPLLQANPELPERLGAVLAGRLAMNQVAPATRSPDEAPANEGSQPSLVYRIGSCLGWMGLRMGIIDLSADRLPWCEMAM